MTEKLRSILRGAGSIVSVNGAELVRSHSPVRRFPASARDGLEEDFRKIGNDLTKSFNEIVSKKTTHG